MDRSIWIRLNLRFLQDIQVETFTGQLEMPGTQERAQDYKLRTVTLGSIFYRDIVLSMWNYKESSGAVSFQTGEVCTVKANAGENV